MDTSSAWAIVLAGGDGARLRPLTVRLAGDARPKQFCPFFDDETLLERTRRRVGLLVRLDREVIVVSQPHEDYYRYLAGMLMPGRLVVQPMNRDTGPGIVYPLLRVAELAGDVPVGIFPSDHYVSDDAAFMSCVGKALEVVRVRSDVVVLLGIEPSYAETEYGWMELGDVPLPARVAGAIFPIRRFWEKPSVALAGRLLARGCLWNTFVMIGWVGAFLDLVESTAPELLVAFAPVRRALGSRKESAAVERVYAKLPAVSFSRRVLARASGYLVAMGVEGVEWSDLGSPRRVADWMRRVRGAGRGLTSETGLGTAVLGGTLPEARAAATARLQADGRSG